MGANQLAKSELFRLPGARELRLLNGGAGQRSRGQRLFQSPAKDAQCPRLRVRGLSQPRKPAGQSGEQKRRPSTKPAFARQRSNISTNRHLALTLRKDSRRLPPASGAPAGAGAGGTRGRSNSDKLSNYVVVSVIGIFRQLPFFWRLQRGIGTCGFPLSLGE